MDLALTWFVLLGVLLAGYAVLDGFDLGVGIVHPFLRNAGERNAAVKAIGPLWDGNEVWLVTFGGALFAAFPEAYATVLSGFYLPVMLLLLCLILRGQCRFPQQGAGRILAEDVGCGLFCFQSGRHIGAGGGSRKSDPGNQSGCEA